MGLAKAFTGIYFSSLPIANAWDEAYQLLVLNPTTKKAYRISGSLVPGGAGSAVAVEGWASSADDGKAAAYVTGQSGLLRSAAFEAKISASTGTARIKQTTSLNKSGILELLRGANVFAVKADNITTSRDVQAPDASGTMVLGTGAGITDAAAFRNALGISTLNIVDAVAVANQAARLALTADQARNTLVKETDTGKSFMLTVSGVPSVNGDWIQVSDVTPDISDVVGLVTRLDGMDNTTEALSIRTGDLEDQMLEKPDAGEVFPREIYDSAEDPSEQITPENAGLIQVTNTDPSNFYTGVHVLPGLSIISYSNPTGGNHPLTIYNGTGGSMGNLVDGESVLVIGSEAGATTFMRIFGGPGYPVWSSLPLQLQNDFSTRKALGVSNPGTYCYSAVTPASARRFLYKTDPSLARAQMIESPSLVIDAQYNGWVLEPVGSTWEFRQYVNGAVDTTLARWVCSNNVDNLDDLVTWTPLNGASGTPAFDITEALNPALMHGSAAPGGIGDQPLNEEILETLAHNAGAPRARIYTQDPAYPPYVKVTGSNNQPTAGGKFAYLNTTTYVTKAGGPGFYWVNGASSFWAFRSAPAGSNLWTSPNVGVSVAAPSPVSPDLVGSWTAAGGTGTIVTTRFPVSRDGDIAIFGNLIYDYAAGVWRQRLNKGLLSGVAAESLRAELGVTAYRTWVRGTNQGLQNLRQLLDAGLDGALLWAVCDSTAAQGGGWGGYVLDKITARYPALRVVTQSLETQKQIVAIASNSTTITVTASSTSTSTTVFSPHRRIPGQMITITGCSVAAYNRTWIIATVTDNYIFTIASTLNPGAATNGWIASEYQSAWDVSSFTSNSTTITVNCTNHGLVVGQWHAIGRCSVAGYNGSWQVATVVSANQYTITSTANPGAATTAVMIRAETITGAAGSTRRNWHFERAVANITSISSSAGVITVIAPGHKVKTNDEVTIAGASAPTTGTYNASWTNSLTTYIDANTFTITSGAATGPSTGGTVTVNTRWSLFANKRFSRVSPAGQARIAWSTEFYFDANGLSSGNPIANYYMCTFGNTALPGGLGALSIGTTRRMELTITLPSGSGMTTPAISGIMPAFVPDVPVRVLAILTCNDGANGRLVEFYHSYDHGVTWNATGGGGTVTGPNTAKTLSYLSVLSNSLFMHIENHGMVAGHTVTLAGTTATGTGSTPTMFNTAWSVGIVLNDATITAITSNGTTMTITAPAHGRTAGSQIFINASDVGAYNSTVPLTIATVPDANTITVASAINTTAATTGKILGRVQVYNMNFLTGGIVATGGTAAATGVVSIATLDPGEWSYSIGGYGQDPSEGIHFTYGNILVGNNLDPILPERIENFQNAPGQTYNQPLWKGTQSLYVRNNALSGGGLTVEFAGSSGFLMQNSTKLLSDFGAQAAFFATGHNDVGVQTETLDRYYKQIVSTMTTAGWAVPPIYIVTQNPETGDNELARQHNTRQKMGMPLTAARNNWTLLDVHAAWWAQSGNGFSMVKPDKVHPTDAVGYPFWASIVFNHGFMAGTNELESLP